MPEIMSASLSECMFMENCFYFFISHPSIYTPTHTGDFLGSNGWCCRPRVIRVRESSGSMLSRCEWWKKSKLEWAPDVTPRQCPRLPILNVQPNTRMNWRIYCYVLFFSLLALLKAHPRNVKHCRLLLPHTLLPKSKLMYRSHFTQSHTHTHTHTHSVLPCAELLFMSKNREGEGSILPRPLLGGELHQELLLCQASVSPTPPFHSPELLHPPLLSGTSHLSVLHQLFRFHPFWCLFFYISPYPFIRLPRRLPLFSGINANAFYIMSGVSVKRENIKLPLESFVII